VRRRLVRLRTARAAPGRCATFVTLSRAATP